MGVITLHNIFFALLLLLLLVFFSFALPETQSFISCVLFHSLFLKVDLTTRMKIRKVSIQGAKDGKGFIKSYTISTRDDASLPWRPFSEDNKIKVNLLKEAANLVSRRGF